MPLPVTVYRWDDAGAPSLGTMKPSEFINVLRKCLVDGYGSKSPLGWTVAFEDAPTNKIAFRKPTAHGDGCVQFWDVTGTDQNQGHIRFRAAKSMLALDSFIHPQIQMQFSMSSNQQYWVLIGTEKGFWFITHHSLTTPNGSTNNKAIFMVGDINSFVTNDPGSFVNVMYRTKVDMTSSSWSNGFDYSMNESGDIARIYDTDGTDNYLVYYMDRRFLVGSSNLSGVPSVDRQFFRPILWSPIAPTQNDRVGVNASVSEISPYYRGELPGLINSPQGGYNNEPWPVIETINGEQHILMPGYNFGRTWINLETWYD
ncbi:hypothetical protein [Shewanella algae]|uniref:hypothetical protein n=1 Tax=Shewanella algae TaxID=38313 RepID=UPI002718AA50|nr:hypothetical protein [Shewanella algae]MDO8254800.1 hypothetical protein [Shewanella algae]